MLTENELALLEDDEREVVEDFINLENGFGTDTVEAVQMLAQRISHLRSIKKAAQEAEVMMDTMSILGIGKWLKGQYRKDYARIHQALITTLDGQKDGE